MGLITYQKFYETTQNCKQPKTFEEFSASAYYTAFVKFGSFVINTAPIYPEEFIDYVVRSGVKLNLWCQDSMYEQYIVHTIKTEAVDRALQRTITTMITWAEDKNAAWKHYFLYVNLNRATHDIKEGLISPWLLLNTKSGKDMLQNMTDEQLAIINSIIDFQFWVTRFKTASKDIEFVKELIKETGLS